MPSLEHSGPRGAGTSGVHSIFPLGSATSVVDPSDLIQDISVPLSPSLYLAALPGSESGIHMIRLDAKPERATARPAIQPEAQPPICLHARPQPEPAQPSRQHPIVDVDLRGVYEDDCASTYVVNFVVIATYQWTDKASGEMMMMWVVGSLDRRQGVVQRLPRIT